MFTFLQLGLKVLKFANGPRRWCRRNPANLGMQTKLQGEWFPVNSNVQVLRIFVKSFLFGCIQFVAVAWAKDLQLCVTLCSNRFFFGKSLVSSGSSACTTHDPHCWWITCTWTATETRTGEAKFWVFVAQHGSTWCNWLISRSSGWRANMCWIKWMMMDGWCWCPWRMKAFISTLVELRSSHVAQTKIKLHYSTTYSTWKETLAKIGLKMWVRTGFVRRGMWRSWCLLLRIYHQAGSIFIYLCIYLSIYPSIYLSIHLVVSTIT